MAEKFRFEKPAGNRGAVYFDKRSLAARAEIVNGARDELFARAGFAGDEDRSTGGRDEFHLGEGALERGAVTDDFLEIELATNFFLEIKLFLGELVLQRVNLFESQRVFHGDGDLRGDLLEKLDVLRRKGVLAAAGEIESAESAALGDERNATDGLHPFCPERANDFVGKAIDFHSPREEWLGGGKADARRSGLERNCNFLMEEAGAARKIESVDFQEAGGGVKKGEAGVVVMNDLFERGDDAAEKVGKLAGGDEHVVNFKENLEAIALSGKLSLVGL